MSKRLSKSKSRSGSSKRGSKKSSSNKKGSKGSQRRNSNSKKSGKKGKRQTRRRLSEGAQRWLNHLMQVYHEGKNEDSEYSLKQAMIDAKESY